MKNKMYLLALNRMPQVGPRTIKKCLARWPLLANMFALSPLKLEEAGLPPKLAHTIKTFDLAQVEADLLWETKPNHSFLTWEDENYPVLLKQIYDSPPVLY